MLSPSPSALRAIRRTLSQFTTSLSAARSINGVPSVIFQQQRYASILGDLRDIASAHTNKKRVGRGPSSGKGKTSGRGHKGQGQRSGLPHNFEGGQTPYIITHGARGFENALTKEFVPLNLDRIQSWIDQGRIDPTKDITLKELMESRCLHGMKDGVKLLARDASKLKLPIHITVNRASAQAIARIEELGGSVTTRFFNKEGMKSIIKPELYPNGHRLAGATSRKDLEYYRDPAHRGYLAHTVKEGESPSLFFRLPTLVAAGKKKNPQAQAQKKAEAENKLF